jgi:hypothetical protein
MDAKEYIGFVDVEEALPLDLQTFFASRNIVIHAGNKVPSPMPDEFFVVLRTGGPRRDMFTDSPQVTVEAYAETDSRAYALMNLLRAWIVTLDEVGGLPVYGVNEVGGIGNLPDPVTKKPRYTATYVMDVRGYNL